MAAYWLTGISSGGGEKVLAVVMVWWWLISIMNVLNATECYTLKWLMLYHVNWALATKLEILATPPTVLIGKTS